jgi:hypothetical protein
MAAEPVHIDLVAIGVVDQWIEDATLWPVMID